MEIIYWNLYTGLFIFFTLVVKRLIKIIYSGYEKN